MQAYGFTHKGYIRANNEDRFLIRELSGASCLLALADGMGGRPGGEVAAQIVIDTVSNFEPVRIGPSERALRSLILRAHEEILNTGGGRPALAGMGSTATLAWIDGNTVFWSHVGDSRLYCFRDHALLQITRDHNLAGMMVERGEFTAEQARSSSLRAMLLQCVGCPECNPDAGLFPLRKGELLLLGSDGLSGGVSHEAMRRRMASRGSALDKARSLLDDALRAGGADNVTLIVAEIT